MPRKLVQNMLPMRTTGAGNDQVRFDLTFNVLAPGIEVTDPDPATLN
jgi:argininosuccinate synthase